MNATSRVSGAICLCLLGSTLVFSQSPDKQRQIADHSRLAQRYLAGKQPQLAERELRAVLELDPRNVDAQGNLGVLLFFQGEYAKAAEQLHGTLQLRPDLGKIQALLGISEKRIGRVAAAKSDLKEAFSRVTEEKLRIEAGLELMELYYGAGDLDEAAGVASALRRLRPADPDILYAAHRVYSDLANECMLSVAMAAPDSARMHQIAGDEMARQGRNEAAIAQYRQALKIDPHIQALHFRIGEMLSSVSGTVDRNAAEQEYKAALAENPFDEKSQCRLGEIAFARVDLKSAFEYYSRALQLQPDDADANLGLGKTLTLMNQPGKAQARLEHAAQLEPFNAVTHYRLSVVYRNLGRAADAQREMSEFRRLKELKERLGEVYSDLRLQASKPERADADVPK